MGKELQVAGNFVYDGLRNLDEMHSLDSTTEIFNIMYLFSVGIERLQKVCIILCVPDNDTNYDELMNEIKHHNHVALMTKISNTMKIKFNSNENEFINLLNKFYKDLRYGRYSLDSYRLEEEKKDFLTFLKRFDIETEEGLFGIPNNEKIKRSIGKVVGGICTCLYTIIKEQSRRLNLYTYEVNFNSKAFKIFVEKSFDFSMEKRALKELIVYLINNEDLKDLLEVIRNIEPLELDVHSLKAIETFYERRELTETVEELYSHLTNQQIKQRQKIIDILTEENIEWELVSEYLLKST